MKKCKNILRIVTIILVVLISCANHAEAFDLDLTVDDDIRKNYNSSRLLNDTGTEDLQQLPDLPDKLKYDNESALYKNTQNATLTKKDIVTGGVKIPKGTAFNVISTTKISDWQRHGTTVRFRTTSPIHKKKFTIPASTVFTGEIIESHQPQLSCNGGLVVIRIRSMVYKGENIPLNAYITRANDKVIFLNNIKGERTYLKTVWKKGNWGRALFNRMLSLTINLGSDGSTILLSPFPFLYGTLCLGANTIVSPVTAFFQKGRHVSINSGSQFRIKLLDDAYIN